MPETHHRFELGQYDHLCFKCRLLDCYGTKHRGCLIRLALKTEKQRQPVNNNEEAAASAPLAQVA